MFKPVSNDGIKLFYYSESSFNYRAIQRKTFTAFYARKKSMDAFSHNCSNTQYWYMQHLDLPFLSVMLIVVITGILLVLVITVILIITIDTFIIDFNIDKHLLPENGDTCFISRSFPPGRFSESLVTARTPNNTWYGVFLGCKCSST